MNAEQKSNWMRKALNVALVSLVVVAFVAQPRLGAVAAAAMVVAWAFDKHAHRPAESCAAGCPPVPASPAAAVSELTPVEPTPSRHEVMMSWVALFA